MRNWLSGSAAALLAAAILVGNTAGTEQKPYPRSNPIVQAVKKARHSIVTIKVRSGNKDHMKVNRAGREMTVLLTLLPGEGSGEIAHGRARLLPSRRPNGEQQGAPAGNRQ